MSSHLTRRDLLLYVDGELSRGRTRRAQEHLHSCWTCRRELESLEQDIGTIVDAQKQSFFPSTPRPVRPWANFEEMAASLPPHRSRPGAWLRQITRLFTAESFRAARWAVGLATMACIVIGALWLTPDRLSAEVVLRRMERAELARVSVAVNQVVRQRVRVERIDRRSSAKSSSEVQSWKVGNRSVWRGDDNDLARRYQSHGLDAALPLSAAACERWLQETGSQAEVEQNNGAVELQATSATSPRDLESASLRVRSDNWRVEALRLTFNDSVFEVSEVDLTVLRTDELSPDLLAALGLVTTARPPVPPPAIEPKPSMPSPPPAVSLAELELHIQFRLHEIGADLSEPIELKRMQREVIINASGATPERKQQLREMFGPGAPGHDPRIRLETEVPVSSRNDLAASMIVPDSTLRRDPDKQLADYFGNTEAQENFTRAVLTADASVLARLYALRNLAEHWPADVEASLSAEARAKLRAMVENHNAALQTSMPELNRLLTPMLENLCGPRTLKADAAPGTWREASASALRAARTLDRNLRALLTTSASGTTLAEACPELRAALPALQSSLASGMPKQ